MCVRACVCLCVCPGVSLCVCVSYLAPLQLYEVRCVSIRDINRNNLRVDSATKVVKKWRCCYGNVHNNNNNKNHDGGKRNAASMGWGSHFAALILKRRFFK